KPTTDLKKKSGVKPGSKIKPSTRAPELPTTSPFELSESDMDMTAAEGDDLSGSKVDSGSDFDLVLPSEATDDMQLELKPEDDAVELGDLPGKGDLTSAAGQSGINLRDPSDSGISLERENAQTDEVDFELTLDADDSLTGPRTGPKPGEDLSD